MTSALLNMEVRAMLRTQVMAFCSVMLLATLAAAQDSDDVVFSDRSGAILYRDPDDNRVVGIVIPGYGNGWHRPMKVPRRLKQSFLYGQREKVDDFRFVDSSAGALNGLKSLKSTEWIIYYGGGASDLLRETEQKRCIEFLDAVAHLPRVEALLIYDAVIQPGNIEELLLRDIDRISIVDCAVVNDKGTVKLISAIEKTSNDKRTPYAFDGR